MLKQGFNQESKVNVDESLLVAERKAIPRIKPGSSL
jgi:hypothetical protein